MFYAILLRVAALSTLYILLSVSHVASAQNTKFTENKPALGLVFGWDIRVTKTGTGLLRTNLRYFPDLHMDIEGDKMMFDHLEFNFIQWVQFLGRKRALREARVR